MLFKVNGEPLHRTIWGEGHLRYKKTSSDYATPSVIAGDVHPRPGRQTEEALGAFVFFLPERLAIRRVEVQVPESAEVRRFEEYSDTSNAIGIDAERSVPRREGLGDASAHKVTGLAIQGQKCIGVGCPCSGTGKES